MFKRFKRLGFLLILFAVGFLFYSTNLGKILGNRLFFYIGLFLIFIVFFFAVKIVGMPTVVTESLKKIRKYKK